MSDDAKAAPKKKGGKMKKMVLIGAGGLLLVGAGASAGIYASGAGLGGHAAEPKEDPNMPKLVLKDGAEDDGHGEAKGHGKEAAFDRAKYKATYFEVKDPFTSNLRDSDGFMQVALGIATYYDERVVTNIEDNLLPIRSAVLMTLADQDAFVVSTPEGKKALQDELKKAINETLEARAGFGGVDNVYFTSLIIQ